MTRAQYIDKVKAKLEEISPFADPASLLVMDNGQNTNVKPIISYIESSLDEAAKDCLNNLPLTLLASDVDEQQYCLPIDMQGVGHLNGMDEYLRFIRVECAAWERDVTAFITSSDPLYLIQQNKYTRGKCSKPVVAYVPERNELELFSFPPSMRPEDCGDCASVHANVYYINCNKKAERVQSKIEDFIVLRCAALVLEILKDQNAATMMAEYNNKINDILK